MIISDLQKAVLADGSRFESAIVAGAGWEIWAQIELFILGKNLGSQVAREVPYPAGNLSLDLLLRDKADNSVHAVELKVESATNAGSAIVAALKSDIAKLAAYALPAGQGSVTKWAIAIAYSAGANGARPALQAYAALPGVAPQVAYSEANNVGVLVVKVP